MKRASGPKVAAPAAVYIWDIKFFDTLSYRSGPQPSRRLSGSCKQICSHEKDDFFSLPAAITVLNVVKGDDLLVGGNGYLEGLEVLASAKMSRFDRSDKGLCGF